MSYVQNLDEELLNLVLDSLDLGVQLPSLIGGNTGGDNRPRNTASPTESSLGRQKDIGDVLVLTEEGKVEDDLNRLDIGGHDNEFADTSVKGLGGFVGTLLELLVMLSLLDQVENLKILISPHPRHSQYSLIDNPSATLSLYDGDL